MIGVVILQIDPELHELLLKPLVVQKLDFLLDIAVVADRLVKVQHHVQTRVTAPPHKIVEMGKNLLAEISVLVEQHDLIEADPDMIHPHRGDVLHVVLGDIGGEVLVVADRQRAAPLVGKNVEPLVVRQPPADPHPPLEADKRLGHHVRGLLGRQGQNKRQRGETGRQGGRQRGKNL